MRLLLGSVFAAYPFAVYYFLDSVSPALFALVLGALLLARVILFRELQARYVWLIAAAIAAFTAVAAADRQLVVLKFYPVILNVVFACLCVYTLINPPSAIQRLVQRLGNRVPGPAAVSYMRRLTCVWMGFFVVNTGAALYTVLGASTQTWALYNGAIVYALIALLMVLELPVRAVYKKRHPETLREALSEQ